MDQVELLQYVLSFLERQSIDYMLVGSLASTFFGEPRFTRDIDIVIELPIEQVPSLCDAFPEPDYYVDVEVVKTAVRGKQQFNVVHLPSGYKIDFLLARDDQWGRTQLARRQRRRILPDQEAYIAAVEDVILGKLWYYDVGESDKHLRDIRAMLDLSGTEIDYAYLRLWAQWLGLEKHLDAVLANLDAH